MKVLVFTDLHGNLNVLHKLKKQVQDEKVDLVLMLGDLTVMGNNLKPLLTRLNMFRAPVLAIHGNHEDEEEMRVVCKTLKNITLIHKDIQEINGWVFGAYSTSGLRTQYPEQEAWVKKNASKIKKAAKSGKFVWLDHAPPIETNVDELAEDWHAGSESLRTFIETYQPSYVLCGHLHECFDREDMIGNTVIINPGPTGKVLDL